MIARHWRSLIAVTIWLLFIVLSVLFSPRPQIPAWSVEETEDSLLRTFDVSAEPTLLVFHRAGGLTQSDRAYVEEIRSTALDAKRGLQLHGADSGETLVLSVAADAADVPHLRAGLQDAPSGLETYVTGAAAFAYDQVAAWEYSRPFILLVVLAISGLVALLCRLNLGSMVVIAASAGTAGTVTSALAPLVAPPSPVALATVLSAGLAGAWAARLLIPVPLHSRTPFVRRLLADTSTESNRRPSIPREVPLLHQALVLAGEVTLLQAFVVIVGLAGFLFDYRVGSALLLGLIVAIAVSLSAAPALTALLTQPRGLQPFRGKVLRIWFRLALALVPVAGFFLLIPTARPTDAIARHSDAAAGYAVLVSAGQSENTALAPSHLLPLHLSIQAAEATFDEAGIAALEDLIASLGQRPALAAVESAEALQQLSADNARATAAELLAALARMKETTAEIESELNAQADALSSAVGDLEGLDLSADLGPLKAFLDEAGKRLDNVKENLASANTSFSRIPTEFPEIASRIDHVPTLRTMPATLETAVSELESVSATLRDALEQVGSPAGNSPYTGIKDLLAEIRTRLTDSVTALKALAEDVSALQGELVDIETRWTEATTANPPLPASGGRLARHDLIHLTLIPADEPYARATLDEVQPLQHAVENRLEGGPLADSVLTWTGVSVATAALRTQALQDLLLRGAILAVVALVLVTWSTLSRIGPTLLVIVGTLLSVAAGIGGAAVVMQEVDVGIIALTTVALVALCGGRMIVGRAATIEDLALALPPLALAVSGVTTLMTIGLALSMGLLTTCFLVIPTLIRRPRHSPPGG